MPRLGTQKYTHHDARTPVEASGYSETKFRNTAQTEFVDSRKAGGLQKSERSNERYVKVVGSAIGERRGKTAQGA